jgi:hypothetical protein
VGGERGGWFLAERYFSRKGAKAHVISNFEVPNFRNQKVPV